MSRTRSVSAHQKVIDAALALVAESGVDATSMDAIAKKSGVSKATIYNHWAGKDALLLDLMAEVHGLHARPKFNSGNTRADVAAVLGYTPPDNTGLRERIMLHFISYSASNVAFGIAWRNLVMEPPRRELKRLLMAGVTKGELSPGLDLDLSVALLLGPLMYWKVFMQNSTKGPRDLAGGVLDSFWKAFSRAKRSRIPPNSRNLSAIGFTAESTGYGRRVGKDAEADDDSTRAI